MRNIAEQLGVIEPCYCSMCDREFIPRFPGQEFCSARCEIEVDFQIDMILEEQYLEAHQ